MQFKTRSTRAIADMICGNDEYSVLFPYRSSSYLTEFFQDCDLAYTHDGSTRWAWVSSCLDDLLKEPQPAPNALPDSFIRVLRTLLDQGDAQANDEGRAKALAALNIPLAREGFEAFFDENGIAHVRHIATKTLSNIANPHRPFTAAEIMKRDQLILYLRKCSEDDLIEEILLPLLRQLGFHRITAAGHKDKALEFGKDIWMKYTLPTLHVIYFGLQVKKAKLTRRE